MTGSRSNSLPAICSLAPTEETRIASGYNRLLETTQEGGAQAKEYMAKYTADRVRNVSTVWLGSTLGCAECHDHKYDPFTTREFYSLGAFFADVQETVIGVQQPTAFPTAVQARLQRDPRKRYNTAEGYQKTHRRRASEASRARKTPGRIARPDSDDVDFNQGRAEGHAGAAAGELAE